jgi:putative glycerol-1-phosphate prenyltransferase
VNRDIYNSIIEKRSKGQKQLAILVDPDKFDPARIIDVAQASGVDYFLAGGSLLTNGNLDHCIEEIRKRSEIPVVLFPGNTMQISKQADAILLLSLISGRNPEMLIGKHVIAAPMLRAAALEVIPTGYMLIESGKQTTVSYISNTTPIPADKDDVAMCTAMAGEMLGMKMIYLEAGSGAVNPVSESMIRGVKANINIPLIVGGGINSRERAEKALRAGADVIVVGNAAEKDAAVIAGIAEAVKGFGS